MNKHSNPDLQGWHRNTELCVDLKTVLRTDFIAGFGKQYPGQLTRDKEDRFSFIETLPPAACRRNPRLFDGKYVTLTRWADGTLHLFFKKMKADADFTVDGYALAVCNEIRQALKGLDNQLIINISRIMGCRFKTNCDSVTVTAKGSLKY